MSQLPEVFSITVFQPLQTSNQSSKIHYCIAGINKDLLINGRMKTEGRLEAYKESKDGPVQHYPQEWVPPCSNALLNAWPCARHMWVPALLKRMTCVYRELCSSSGSDTSVYSNWTPNTRATGSRDSSEMASSLRGGRHHRVLKSDTSCAYEESSFSLSPCITGERG